MVKNNSKHREKNFKQICNGPRNLGPNREKPNLFKQSGHALRIPGIRHITLNRSIIPLFPPRGHEGAHEQSNCCAYKSWGVGGRKWKFPWLGIVGRLWKTGTYPYCLLYIYRYHLSWEGIQAHSFTNNLRYLRKIRSTTFHTGTKSF
jgi:hypothetical protein